MNICWPFVRDDDHKKAALKCPQMSPELNLLPAIKTKILKWVKIFMGIVD